MNQRIGSCSLCGCDVMGFVGAWMSINQPPPPRCSGCGATAAGGVIPMSHPGPVRPIATPTVTGTGGASDWIDALGRTWRLTVTNTNGVPSGSR